MNSFNPSNYSELSESIIDVSSEMVEKGHKNNVKVDMEKFEDLCKRFKEIKDTKIKKLSSEDKKNFDVVVNYVHMLYGTPFYKKLFERVKKHFKNVSSTKPGTIGSYFAGCMNAVNNGDEKMLPGCAVACVGSMPLPKGEEGWAFCDKAVIVGEKSGDGYFFSIVKPAEDDEDTDPTYVFVEGQFEGLSREEKVTLLGLGCRRIKLISYSDDNYKDVYDEPKNLSDVEERAVEKEKEGKVEKGGKRGSESASHSKSVTRSSSESDSFENDNSRFWVFLIFVILIILFLFVLYRYYKMKYVQ
jgi:hypothetical protein